MTEPEEIDYAKVNECVQASVGVGFAAMDMLSVQCDGAGMPVAEWVGELISRYGKPAYQPLWIIWARTIAKNLNGKPVSWLWPQFDGSPVCGLARNAVKYMEAVSGDDYQATFDASDSMGELVDAAIRLDQMQPRQVASRPAIDVVSNLLAATAGEMLPQSWRSLQPEDDPREPFSADTGLDAPDGAVLNLCDMGRHGWWERQGDMWHPLHTKANLDHELADCPFEQL